MTPFQEVRCPKCGWVHLAVPAEVARGHAPEPENYARYLSCRSCGADSATFVPAGPNDAPIGATMQGCVIERPTQG